MRLDLTIRSVYCIDSVAGRLCHNICTRSTRSGNRSATTDFDPALGTWARTGASATRTRTTDGKGEGKDRAGTETGAFD